MLKICNKTCQLHSHLKYLLLYLNNRSIWVIVYNPQNDKKKVAHALCLRKGGVHIIGLKT